MWKIYESKSSAFQINIAFRFIAENIIKTIEYKQEKIIILLFTRCYYKKPDVTLVIIGIYLMKT